MIDTECGLCGKRDVRNCTREICPLKKIPDDFEEKFFWGNVEFGCIVIVIAFILYQAVKFALS